MQSPEPLYVKHSELFIKQGTNIQLCLCQLCDQHVPGQVIGTQFFNGIWSIWLRSNEARSTLISKVNHLHVNNRDVPIYSTYPLAKNVPNEKILFKDIPIGVSDDDLLSFLRSQEGIIVKTGIIPARLRDNENRLTPFLSGDRFVYVKGNFSPVLHPSAILGGSKCKVLHKSQHEACLRCRHLNHKTHETHKCDAYSDDQEVITIKSPLSPLSNYFMCSVKVFGHNFVSSEHAYQWRFLTYLDLHDLAHEVLNSSTAAEAKSIASRVPNHLHRDWHKIKVCIMREILHAKADTSNRFRDALLQSAGKRLIESVRGDIFWSSGLSPLLAASTKSSYFPGGNMLGYVLESIRQDLMREAILSEEFGIAVPLGPDCVPSEFQPENNVPEISDTPLPLPPPTLHLSIVLEEGTVNMNKEVVSTPLASPETPSLTPTPETSASSSEPTSLSPPSSCSNLTDPLVNQSKDDDVNTKEKGSVKSNKRRSTDTMTQGTITAAFDKCKRKLSPNKEADTERDNHKVSRGDASSI